MSLEPWQAIVQKKQAEASAKIPAGWRLPAHYTADISESVAKNVLFVPRDCGLLSPKQLEITEAYDATALLEKIHSGQVSAAAVVEAFCIRAAIAQQLVRIYFGVYSPFSHFLCHRLK
jgi:amidase